MTMPRGSILLADDEDKILKRLGRALRDDGHEVVEVSSARAARQLISERPFDLLVLDNIMPGMTGLELVREITETIDSEKSAKELLESRGMTVNVPKRDAFMKVAREKVWPAYQKQYPELWDLIQSTKA